MRGPDEVVAALEAQLGMKLGAPSAEALRVRLQKLGSQFACIDAARLGQGIASRVNAGPSLSEDLEALHLEDLLLALACLAHDAAALAQLDAGLAQVIRSLRRGTSADEEDELKQQLRIRLLVNSATAPAKLSLYAGRGRLGGFMRVVALNLFNHAQAAGPEGSDGALAALPDRGDWESQVLQLDQQAHFREAFRRAVRLLTARQRALLRLNLLDGLSIDELSPLYGAHRSSVARWLAEARAALDTQTRKLMSELLKLDAEEVERLLTSTQNGFELSLGRALRESLPPQAP